MAKNIVILTGAGISAESGIPTFRGIDGLWEGHSVTEVASPEGFARNPALVHRFYNQRRAVLETVQANAAHEALAELERGWKGDFLLVTQNVDDLHERGGSKSLIHMHGELLSAKCTSCEWVGPWTADTNETAPCPKCSRSNLRPDIVWFGEMPYHMERIITALAAADIFVSIGTSGNVYPAAGFVQIANQQGAHSIEANLEPTEAASPFAETIYGPATQIIPRLVQSLLAAQ